MDKREKLQAVVDSASPATMRSVYRRREFAAELARQLNLWEPPVQELVVEMAGLNFYKAEDRKTFITFFLCAYAF